MKDVRLQRLAGLIVGYSLEVRKGEYVFVQGNNVTEPLLRELYREILRCGAYPEIKVTFDWMNEILLRQGEREQIQYLSVVQKTVAEKCDAMIYILGAKNLKTLTNIDPKNIALHKTSKSEIIQILNQRENDGKFRWFGTQFPTDSEAQLADMSLEEYEEFLYKSLHLDKDDPVEEWRRISKRQQRMVDYLNTKNELHIISKGTDLKLKVGGRKWVNCDGRINLPDGEVFTCPVENSAEGSICISYPGMYLGREIEDIRLEFKEGVIIKASASKGEDLLTTLLDVDEGARRLGEIAIGTNYELDKFTKNVLFDEKIGGTIHIAVGDSIAGTGGENKSCIHWDLICDMRNEGKIYADDELFYANGNFIDGMIDWK